MNKILQIAQREFLATVMTKGFLFGLLAVPLMMGLMILIMPLLINQKAPRIAGEIALLDLSGGAVGERLAESLRPESLAERRRLQQRRISEALPPAMRGLASPEAMSQGMDQALGEVPNLRTLRLAPQQDLELAKQPLTEGKAADDGRLALLVVHANAVHGEEGASLGSFDLFIRAKLDDRLVDELREAARDAIVETRLAVRQLDAREIRELTRVPRVVPSTVDASGERAANQVASTLLPMFFMVLMLVAVMTAGQQLMTSTIEEKSSRVVEVLLAAVSPTELMAGKILGQLGVGLLMLTVYAGLGLLALFTFALAGLIDAWQLFYFVIFFLIAFVVLASLMAAVGAAVNELREAQVLITPIVLVAVLPMMLWMPISRDPSSVLATTLSLLPPVNPFVMMLRISSHTPPPTWQIWLSIGIGVASVFAAVWFAGKVFRVGLLMHGKPPDFRTLWRWVRMS